MKRNIAVEVYLGNPIEEASEQHLLARLVDDLNRLGIPARIFANVSLGSGLAQVDFVIITPNRIVLVEQKTYRGPIVSGPENGHWMVRIGEAAVEERGNAVQQAVRNARHFGDLMQRFARKHGAPPPTRGKYVKDIDTVVCLYPAIQSGTNIAPHRHVDIVGYEGLLARLQKDGPRPLWSADDWDAFRRRQNLYRAEEDSPENAMRLAGGAAVDEYRGRFLSDYNDLPPQVKTRVRVDGETVDRPDAIGALHRGETVQIVGSSEMGKSLWATWIAAELAGAGSVPIWLAADVCEAELLKSATRAIAPYTDLTARSLLAAADAAGRPVVFIIDDLSRASERDVDGLLRGVSASRIRSAQRGLLTTSQKLFTIPADAEQLTVELVAPSADERRAVLAAYGAEDLIDRCGAFTTPLELSIAAQCAGDLPSAVSTPQLLDRYVDQLTDGDDRLRGALRALAQRMHESVRPALPRPDVARTLHRDFGLDDVDLRRLFECRLVEIAHGKVLFRHERYERFLAAEAVTLDAVDADGLARVLNLPQAEPIREDAIALISHPTTVAQVIGMCENSDTLIAATFGKLGPDAAAAVDSVLAQALSDACAQTTAPGHTVRVEGFRSRWQVAGGLTRAQAAQMRALGHLVIFGRNIDKVAQLLDLTDQLYERTIASADPTTNRAMLDDHLFACTYALGPGDLPGSLIVQSAVDSAWNAGPLDDVVERLLDGLDCASVGGRFYLASQLLRRSKRVDVATELAVRAMKSRRYHLRLAGLTLGESFATLLEGDKREQVITAARALFAEDNIVLNTAIVETLESLDAIDAAKGLADVHHELQTILSLDDTDLAQKMAYGAFSAQFETSAIGPYYEAIHDLNDDDALKLRALALAAMPDYAMFGEILISELGKLGGMHHPDGAAAVDAFIARSNPIEWVVEQSTMSAVCIAVDLLAQAGRPLPPPGADGSTNPAWHCLLELIRAVLADVHGTSEQPNAVARAWNSFLSEHRAALASGLRAVHYAHRLTDGSPDVHQHLLRSMPTATLDVLIWSIEQPDQLTTMFRWDRGDVDHVIALLGELGDERAAAALRRLAADGTNGLRAVAAVRRIEMRAAH